MMWVLHVIQTCSKVCAIVLILINFSSSENISESLSVNRTNHSVKHVPTNRISSRISSRLNNIETIPLYKLLQEKNLTVENSELLKASWPRKIFQCIRSRNIFQCMKIFLLQRSEMALERINMNQLSKTNISWFDDILTLQNDSSVDFVMEHLI
ncbi:uncharacterized protein LOC123290398 [Chrysoperla carnea]|uniref:uncharacterized protein LOC123290398 n=1 Tax=Chrysoperla carnea TaxID=189513 RepID=UPI001D08E4AD|nr:uncharacterized protein LOC123290398 [Chrysoperla carnea]